MPEVKNNVLGLFKEIWEDFKKRKKTIVFITHDTSQIIRVCDRALVLQNSKIDLLGDPSMVVQRYIDSQNKFS